MTTITMSQTMHQQLLDTIKTATLQRDSAIAKNAELLAALRMVASLPGFEPTEPYGITVLSVIAAAQD